jgi:glycosyltransferase involved in cell wall biosynthesis
MGALFNNYVIVIFYDHSTDNTLQILQSYQNTNPRLSFYINNSPISQYRTHRIAHARNYCLNEIRMKYAEYPYFIMMDFDDPNSKNCNLSVLERALKREDWDALSFNTSPAYYDIWGLSIYPYCFSYNHFQNNNVFYKIIQDYVTFRLNNLKKNSLLPCISSFNGFAIYRTNKFLNSYYDGSVRSDLFPKKLLQIHSIAQKSKGLVYIDYGHVKGKYEDCEHRAFHQQARINSGARIMISPEIVFL